MKILVCISNVPDTTTKVKFTDDRKNLLGEGIQWIINPWDELALTRALQLKESPNSQVEKITAITVGPALCEPTLRKALAIGADDAIRIDADPADAFSVAGQIAETVKQKSYEVIMCGIESADHNGSAVGGMLAEFLGYPSVSAVSSLNIEGNEIVIYREVDGGKEKLTISEVISTCKCSTTDLTKVSLSPGQSVEMYFSFLPDRLSHPIGCCH